jgi:hypothetical protein
MFVASEFVDFPPGCFFPFSSNVGRRMNRASGREWCPSLSGSRARRFPFPSSPESRCLVASSLSFVAVAVAVFALRFSFISPLIQVVQLGERETETATLHIETRRVSRVRRRMRRRPRRDGKAESRRSKNAQRWIFVAVSFLIARRVLFRQREPTIAQDEEDDVLPLSPSRANGPAFERPSIGRAAADVQRCEELASSWVREQRADYERRRQQEGADFLFFLHVPRTAGRSFHFCFLKTCFDAKAACENQYNGVKIDPSDAKCKFLATHDDYSLVERFQRQPKVVMMMRKPSARLISAYEFAVEVSARTFGLEPSTPANTTKRGPRVQTRDVWPWTFLIRDVDRQLKQYERKIKEHGDAAKVAIHDVYNTEIYTPFEDWLELPIVHDDMHNGQFFQLLGITNNTNADVEPRAAELRTCALWRGTKGAKVLMNYAKERLENEIDSLAMHERLEESIELSALELRLSLKEPAVYVEPAHADKANLRAKLVALLESDDGDDEDEVVGVVFRFTRLKAKKLDDESFRQEYVQILAETVARRFAIDASSVVVSPVRGEQNWVGFDGFHVLAVKFAASSAARELYEILKSGEAAVSREILAPGFENHESYGVFEMSAYGIADSKRVEVDVVQTHKRRNVGEQYRFCEARQMDKYARLRRNALDKFTTRIHGKYDTFSKQQRLRIPRRVMARADELNWLDYELWKFADDLFDRRIEEARAKLDLLPPKPKPRGDAGATAPGEAAKERMREHGWTM